MLRILILVLGLLVIGADALTQEPTQDSEVLKSDDVLEKYIDRANQRKCDSNLQTSFYKCSCKLSIHYPFFVKENKSAGLKKVNQYMKKYIDDYRKSLGQCNADGNDFGENRLSYVIFYQDKKYISIGTEKFFCCDDYGENHSYKIFNFNQDTGNLVEINNFIDQSNLSSVEKYIMNYIKVYVENLPKDFKVLTSIQDQSGQPKVKLMDTYAQYYFTENSIAIKVRPDVLGSNLIDVKLPPSLIKPRYYPIIVDEEDLDDNTNDVLKKKNVTGE